MGNYLDLTGLEFVLQSLDSEWMGTNGLLGYTTNANNRNYAVQRDETSKKLYVNVPWVNTTYTNGDGITLSSNIFSHADTNTNNTAGSSYGPSAGSTLAAGGTFNIPYITLDGFGHISNASTKTFTLPSSVSSADSFSENVSITLSGDVTGSASGKAGWSIDTTLSNSGVTTGSYGPSAGSTLNYSGTFTVPYITFDAKGRATAASDKTFTLPAQYTHPTVGPSSTANTSVGGNTAVTLAEGSTFKIPSLTINKEGHATIASDVTITMPTEYTAKEHTHNYAGSDSAGGAANSVKQSLTVKLNGGTTEGTNLFTYNGAAAKTIDITPSSIGTKTSSEITSEINEAVENAVASTFKYKGVISKDSDLPASHKKGDIYFVKLSSGTATIAGQTCENGDMLICNTNGSSANNAHWDVVQGNWTATDGTAALSWGNKTTLATIGGVTIDAQLPSLPSPEDIDAHPVIKEVAGSGVSISSMKPNQLYVFGTVSSMTISSFDSELTGIYSEYMLEFVAGFNGSVSVPGSVKWANGIAPVIISGKTYQISIVNNLGVWGQF